MHTRPFLRICLAAAAIALPPGAVAEAQRTEPLPSVLPPPADSRRRIPRTRTKAAPPAKAVAAKSMNGAPAKSATADGATAKDASHGDPAATDAAAAAMTAQLKAAIRRSLRGAARPPAIGIAPGPAAAEGTFSRITVEAKPARIDHKIELAALWLRAEGARFDPAALREGRLEPLSGKVTARLVISEANITALLAKQPPTAGMNFKARVLKDSIEIRGRSTAGLVQGDIRLIGKLTLPDGQIGFSVTSLHIDGAPASPFVKALAQAQINAALTVEAMPFRPKFRKVTYEAGQVVVAT